MRVGRGGLHTGLGGEVGGALKRRDELGPAVGVARVVHGVDADEQVHAAQHLGECKRIAEEDGVAGRHVGDGDVRGHRALVAVFGHVQRVVGERAAAKGPQVDRRGAVAGGAQRLGHAGGGGQLDLMTLAVIKTQAVAGKALGPGHGEHGGAVQAAREQDHGGPRGIGDRVSHQTGLS